MKGRKKTTTQTKINKGTYRFSRNGEYQSDEKKNLQYLKDTIWDEIIQAQADLKKPEIIQDLKTAKFIRDSLIKNQRLYLTLLKTPQIDNKEIEQQRIRESLGIDND